MKCIFLGTQGFPYGMAEVEKQTLIARALVEQGCKVTFVCNKSFDYKSTIPFKGIFKGVNYIYTSFISKRLQNKILNRVIWFLGNFIETIYLLIADYDFAILNSRNYDEINKYSTILHLRNKKLYLTLTEDYRSMHPNTNKKILSKIEDFENKTWTKIDGVFPISEELIRQVKNENPNLPQLKIPVLTDLKDAEDIIIPDDMPHNDYFMFCGSADYFDTINFIIKGFEIAKTNSKLLLVVNGNKESMKCVNDRIEMIYSKDRIVVKSGLDKRELWGYYKFAKALLIPLNFDQRDKARFPHKIGEYCAVGKPIITSNWGEIPNYFFNNENCILLECNDSFDFGNAMSKVEENSELREKIGSNAYNLAIKEFDYKLYGEKIMNFINL